LISLVPSSFSFEQLFVVKDLLLSFCILICLFVLLNSKAKKVLRERERERERKETRLISVSVFSNSFWVKAFACLLAFLFCLFVFDKLKSKKKKCF